MLTITHELVMQGYHKQIVYLFIINKEQTYNSLPHSPPPITFKHGCLLFGFNALLSTFRKFLMTIATGSDAMFSSTLRTMG